MKRVETSKASGMRRRGSKAFAVLLASHVYTAPLPVFAQQAPSQPTAATSTATPGLFSTSWSQPQRASEEVAGFEAEGVTAENGATESGETTASGQAAANGATPDPTTVTGSLPATEAAADDGLARDEDLLRQNLPEGKVDGVGAGPLRSDEDETGIRLGSFILRPSLSQQLGHERQKTASGRESRTFSETGLKGTLTSDWSRHELSVTGDGAWQETLNGEGSDKPRAALDARLRLDLSDDTIVGVTGNYNFSREDTDDPNALAGAAVQSGVNQYGGGLSIERDFGLIRGSLSGDVTRYQYSDAELSDGTTVQRSERDRIRSTVTGRVTYELSPALMPFAELTGGRIHYDETLDSAGFRRSADVYGAKAGVMLDLGEKLRGELALGHEQQRFDDNRLSDLKALTIDGNLAWSPREGTTLDLALDTSIDPSTTAGVNGSVIHRLTASLAHDIRSNLVARLTGGTTLTRYEEENSASDTTAYLAGAGLTWKVNSHLDATADLNFERTHYQSGTDSDTLTALIGLTAKR
ncbi:outer membrane beta-barrel protein [Rhizobium sp. G187]|uniref:outer membrane beta-barrel protein n=1 Tax=Rhizobium sp. G187 TaxID=3451352 RepID=UPI003EE7CA7C